MAVKMQTAILISFVTCEEIWEHESAHSFFGLDQAHHPLSKALGGGFPKVDYSIPLIIEEVAVEVFGEGCLSQGAPIEELSAALKALIHHAWECQRKCYRHAEATLDVKKWNAAAQFKEVFDKEEPTVAEFPEESGVDKMDATLTKILETAIKSARKLPHAKNRIACSY
ncbi:hypothetical protein HYDPIDRAFT_171205 [Hydnomerulius pinastri MD-312]|uniref:Uncharacterized protein n=1 Tax=Hydnomerulius pinastri MD-312 TaxID=994086 RepID=A0A0C9W739_9AGAM|nr:hypothetical protein HYDPIDRAFT_171205 [Hydnomerulius pinastri MD-312]